MLLYSPFSIFAPQNISYAMTQADDNKKREKGIYRVTSAGSIVNVLLLAFKFVAGILGNSAAMLADAVHSLSDFITDIVVLLFVRLSNKPVDKGHDFGHGKYETLATAIIGLVLLAVGIGILWSGAASIYGSIRGNVPETPGAIALAAAAISIVSKEILYRYTVKKGKQFNSQAVVANAWHHRSDAFSSIGTLIGIGGAILLGESWRILDPIAAVIVSIFIIKAAIQLSVPSINDLLEKSLPESVEQEIVKLSTAVPGVSQPHNLRTRRIGNYYAIELHVRMDGSLSLQEAHRTATEIENKLKAHYGANTHIIIHVEPTKGQEA